MGLLKQLEEVLVCAMVVESSSVCTKHTSVVIMCFNSTMGRPWEGVQGCYLPADSLPADRWMWPHLPVMEGIPLTSKCVGVGSKKFKKQRAVKWAAMRLSQPRRKVLGSNVWSLVWSLPSEYRSPGPVFCWVSVSCVCVVLWCRVFCFTVVGSH